MLKGAVANGDAAQLSMIAGRLTERAATLSGVDASRMKALSAGPHLDQVGRPLRGSAVREDGARDGRTSPALRRTMFAHGSKSRLTEKDLGRFAGDTLLDRIGRAVCRAGVLPRKELFEAWEVARRTRRLFRGGRVMDLAGGHGLLAHVMLLLDDSSPRAIVVDTSVPASAARLQDCAGRRMAPPPGPRRHRRITAGRRVVAPGRRDRVESRLWRAHRRHPRPRHERWRTGGGAAVLPRRRHLRRRRSDWLAGRRRSPSTSAGSRASSGPATVSGRRRFRPRSPRRTVCCSPRPRGRGGPLPRIPHGRRMTVAERINAERVVLAGWSRAILLQLAHPLVAQGVADHSTFRAGLFTAAVRLHHTVQAMRHLTFGGEARARLALDGILAIHRRVNGTLRGAVGPYPAGTAYSAEDPALVLWVHATLLDSLPIVYAELVQPLSAGELDAWCMESAPVARALGAGDDVPTSWATLQAYLTRMHCQRRHRRRPHGAGAGGRRALATVRRPHRSRARPEPRRHGRAAAPERARTVWVRVGTPRRAPPAAGAPPAAHVPPADPDPPGTLAGRAGPRVGPPRAVPTPDSRLPTPDSRPQSPSPEPRAPNATRGTRA